MYHPLYAVIDDISEKGILSHIQQLAFLKTLLFHELQLHTSWYSSHTGDSEINEKEIIHMKKLNFVWF